MAFGRVTIRTASGEIREYELTKPTTSIGRQPGNDIVLNTAAVSRYHAQFDTAEGQVYLVDLGTVNGTFVNDEQVEPGGSVALQNGDRVVMGDVLLIFSSPRSPGRFDISLTPTPTVVEEEGVPFRIVLDKPHQLLAPGARMQLILVIENRSDERLTLDVGTGGLEEDWVKISRLHVTLDPREEAEVLISLRPPRTSTTHPGRYPLTVRVSRSDKPRQALEVVREIDIVGYGGLALAAKPDSDQGHFHIVAQNQGNMPIDVSLEGFDPNDELTYQFRPARLTIPPGETARAALRVDRRGRHGDSYPVPFAVVAHSQDAAGFRAPVYTQYAPARKRRVPLVITLLPILLGALVIAGLAAGGALLLGLWSFGQAREAAAPTAVVLTETPTATVGPTPTIFVPPTAGAGDVVIDSFDVSPSEVTFRVDALLTLKWAIDGEVSPGQLTLTRLADDTQETIRLSREDVQSGSVTIPASELKPGVHNFQLAITNEAGEVVVRSLTGVTVQVETCSVADPNASILTEPGPQAELVDPPRTSDEIVILGRTEDGSFVWLAYDDLDTLDTRGWLPTAQITCPPDVALEDYVVVSPEDVVLTPSQASDDRSEPKPTVTSGTDGG
jgi:hypothetical protein